MECGAVWVRVSLGAYFKDERARCMMMVPGGGSARRAGWLARRLRRTFGLPRRPALLCQGHLLPPAEPLPTRAPLLQLEAVPPSGRVVDVSRQRGSDEDSDPQTVVAGAERASARSPPAAPPAASIQDDADGESALSLDEVKRRALALLDVGEAGEAGEAGGARRRRVRVRRRRAAPPPEVLHNEEESRRAPRRVRALSPAPPAPHAPHEPPATDPHDPFLTS